MRSGIVGGILTALVLSLFAVPASATTVPCDKSRVVTPVESLKDGTYGRTWERNYGTVQMSWSWPDRRDLALKVGVIRTKQTLRSFWIREVYHVCRGGKLQPIGRAHLYYVSRGAGVVPSGVKPLRVDRWSARGLIGMAFDGIWLTSRVTIEMPNGKRSSLRATIRVFPPEGATNPSR